MKPGSIVICIAGGAWYNKVDERVPGPEKDDILTVRGHYNENYLLFEEWQRIDSDGTPASFDKSCFRELIPPADKETESYFSKPKTADCI